MEIKKPLPIPDADTRFFWEGCAQGKLYIQQCADCEKHIFYPRIVCPHCLSSDIHWIEASGRGRIYSYSIIHRSEKAFAQDVPYVVALIDLEEGVRLMSNVINVDPDQVTCDMPVKVVFVPEGDMVLPKFEPL